MKKYYSQYGEDLVIDEFFNNRKGTVLDLGANDGITFSNSRVFLESGWSGALVEASPITFKKLLELYKGNSNVYCIEKCLSDIKKKTNFYHNIYHPIPGGRDNCDILSTIVESSYQRTAEWGTFTNFEIECDTIDAVLESIPFKKFEYVTIDIEGMDLQILQQMDLNNLGVELLLIEHNGVIREEVIEYCSKYGLNEILLENSVNIILHK
jgi:FkbM family methyltransferase